MSTPFLWQSEDKWPSYPGVEELSEDDPEDKKDAKYHLKLKCEKIRKDYKIFYNF